MTYGRRALRVGLRSTALITLRTGDSFLGEVTDLSTRGAGLELPRRLDPGTQLTILLDPGSLPTASGRGLPSLSGVVRSVRAGVRVDGVTRFQHGFQFTEVSPAVAAHIRAILAPQLAETLPTAVDLVTGEKLQGLITSALGREHLFQSAHELLSAGLVAAAKEAINIALLHEPDNRRYQAFRARVNVEEALLEGNVEGARRHLTLAHELAPDDEELSRLDARVGQGWRPPPPPPRRRLLRWLTGAKK